MIDKHLALKLHGLISDNEDRWVQSILYSAWVFSVQDIFFSSRSMLDLWWTVLVKLPLKRCRMQRNRFPHYNRRQEH